MAFQSFKLFRHAQICAPQVNLLILTYFYNENYRGFSTNSSSNKLASCEIVSVNQALSSDWFTNVSNLSITKSERLIGIHSNFFLPWIRLIS